MTSTSSPSEKSAEQCSSCLGAGEIGTENGPVPCPDCFGEGKQLDSLQRTEWRMRDIERNHTSNTHGCDVEVRWLIFELRRTREALVRIMSRCQEEGREEGQEESEGSNLAGELQFVANQALGLYGVKASG